jgi:UDP-galactopyranose mutase
MKIIIGAGITGATIARILAEKGNKVLVIEKENHVGGACYDIIEDGLPITQFGGHIFHTNDEEVWKFVNRFTEFYPYEHRVIAYDNNLFYTLPLNFLTLNQFGLKSIERAKEYFKNLNFVGDNNFEERAISTIGYLLYEKFFYHYTKKQWGMEPKELPAFIFSRLPVRLNMDTRYFSDKYQGMPKNGYTKMIENILDHPYIEVRLNEKYEGHDRNIIYTGNIDEYYNYKEGQLQYRSIYHKWVKEDDDNYGSATINHVGPEDLFTRTITFNHFYPHIKTNKFVTAIEYARSYNIFGGEPLYPIPTKNNLDIYNNYKSIDNDIIFAGRLGSYKYLNIDAAIKLAMNIAGGL